MTTRKSGRGAIAQTTQRTREQAEQAAQKAKVKGAEVVQGASELKGGALTFKNFVKKVYNDWSLHLAQALAYSLITAMVPIAILLVAIFGWFLGGLDHQAYTQLLSHIEKSLPQPIASPQIIDSAAQKLQNASGPLAIISVLSALFFGSRFFALLEVCFDLVYHVDPRPSGRKNAVALAMVVVSVVLVPVLALASLLPGQIVGLLQHTIESTNSGIVTSLIGILSSLIVSFVLFEVMYIFVPNRQGALGTRIRNSWRGALAASVVLQICLVLFPLYTHAFFKNYVGQLSFVLILLVFFYLLALMLLLGAQINAFFVEKIPPFEKDLITRAS